MRKENDNNVGVDGVVCGAGRESGMGLNVVWGGAGCVRGGDDVVVLAVVVCCVCCCGSRCWS